MLNYFRYAPESPDGAPSEERPVTIDIGTNLLIGADRPRLLAEVDNVLRGTFKSGARPPLWDGKATERVMEVLGKVL